MYDENETDAADARHDTPPSEEFRSARWSDHVDPKNVNQAITYLTNRLPSGTEALRPFSACLATVLGELDRLRADTVELESTEGVVEAAGLQWFMSNGDHITNVARWAAQVKASNVSVLDLRVLAAHLTTALDGVTAALKSKGV